MVLEVEFVFGGKFALTDVLVDIDGNLAPTTRDMRWVLQAWMQIRATIPDIPVYLRRYFGTMEDATLHAKAQGFPCDGVVGLAVKNKNKGR